VDASRQVKKPRSRADWHGDRLRELASAKSSCVTHIVMFSVITSKEQLHDDHSKSCDR
jgi:hypothetical protein